MPVHVSRPAVVFPRYEVELDQILTDIQTHHADHAELRRILRIVGRTGVQRRRFTRPLEQVARSEPIEERNRRTFADVCALGEQAARALLAEQGVEPGQVDCVVTSHSTGIAIPGLDVHLLNALGLRPDVRRIPMTQLGCTGGALALVRAVEQVRPPGVLFVLAVGGLGPAQRAGQVRRGPEGRGGGVGPAGAPGGDLLDQPQVAVRIGDGEERPVAGEIGRAHV